MRDVVVAGHDRDAVTALLVPFDAGDTRDPAVREALTTVLQALAAEDGGECEAGGAGRRSWRGRYRPMRGK